MCSSGLEARSCLFNTKFFSSNYLRFITIPDITTCRLLPPVLPCQSWFVSLFAVAFFIFFCRAVGHFLKFLFFLGWLCKLFEKTLVCGTACTALAMCLQNGQVI